MAGEPGVRELAFSGAIYGVLDAEVEIGLGGGPIKTSSRGLGEIELEVEPVEGALPAPSSLRRDGLILFGCAGFKCFVNELLRLDVLIVPF